MVVINRIIRLSCCAPLLYQRRRCAKGDSVEIKEMVPEDSCSSDMLVIPRWQNRNVAVPLSQLVGFDLFTVHSVGRLIVAAIRYLLINEQLRLAASSRM